MKKIISFSLLFSLMQFAKSQTGLDPTFGTGGIGTYSPMPESQAQAIAVQADGKIVVAGLGTANPLTGPIIRLNTNGTMDASFNGTGTVLIPTMTSIESIAVQPDGKIVLAGIGFENGTSYNVFMAVRLNTDGSYDNSFGTNGIVYVDIVFGVDYGQAVALQPDGKIVIAGNSQVPGGDFDISIIRLLNNGSLDNSFDGDGKMVLERNGTTEYESGLVVQPDGKIIVEGKTYLGPDADLMVARINAGGGLDNSFGINGVFTFEVIDGYEPYFGKTLALQPDGKILVGRNSHIGDGITKFIALRINPDGTPDNSFDSDGFVTVVFGGMEDICTAIALQADGKIILSGYSFGPAPNRSDIALARLNSDGSLDNCFNQTGKLVIPRTDWDEAVDMVLQPDGKILVTGYTENPSTSFIVMRIQSTGGTGVDVDGDGYNSCVDCNDNNAAIHPGATEVCNSVDDDCDGLIDEGVQITFYGDFDGDSYGNPAVTVQACTLPAGYVTNSTDCNDNNVAIHPGATEVCNTVDDDCDGLIDEGVQLIFYRDFDGDSYGNPAVTAQACTAPAGYIANNTDCNDNNAAIHPEAIEICNSVDDDCDGLIDEGVLITFYRDLDNDGYGNSSITTQACAAPAGYVANNTDCNDNNPAIHPGATEVCNTVDDDCDGLIDEGVLITFYRDFDNDGYGNSSITTQACAAPAGYVANNTDCNDNNAAIHPGATEVCNTVDDDCDGLIDEGCSPDNDGDGYTVAQGDCNDNDPAIHPGATEVCNNVDDDCDGQTDEGLTPPTWYADSDGDSYGRLFFNIVSCTQPAGYAPVSGDCDDNDPAIYPGAPEICNMKDDDCDGQIDEGVTPPKWYADTDGDGYGNFSFWLNSCTQPTGYVDNGDDCNDFNAAIHPGATEICNMIDDDCDGQIDEGVTPPKWYADTDGDGYGNFSFWLNSCTQPAGYVDNGDDCNDFNAAIHPGAIEICNMIDDDCDGQIDEGVTPPKWYADTDGDGYGNFSFWLNSCTQPAGYVDNGDDCNDFNAAIHPGATEICNMIDDDCDGQIDEGVTPPKWYADTDGDGYGNFSFWLNSCTQPAGYVDNGDDCHDFDPAIHPGATEICNMKDDDCDGQIDEGVEPTNWYVDSDGDGYGRYPFLLVSCTQPPGYVNNAGDCNDFDPAIHPGATETCNMKDDDCDGQIDEGAQSTFYRDFDGDNYGNPSISVQGCIAPAGYVNNNTDCNDNNPAIHPGATEVCNTVDDDCDGLIDEGVQPTFYRDTDGDSYGNPSVTVQECTAPAGFVSNSTDCNDNDAAIHPGATEICGNGVDDNCNGQVDENTAIANIVPAGEVSLCSGTDVLLSANNGPGLSYQWFRNNIALTGETAATITVTIGGNYSVRVTNSGNCVATSSATVVIPVNTPNAGISIQGGGNNCPVNMQAHPGGPVIYQWYKNNIQLAGATQRNYSASTSGSYTVTVTKDGCSATSSPVIVASCPQFELREYTKTKAEPLSVPDQVKIFPNPARENFMAELILDEKTSGEAIIQLTTISGTILTSQKTVLVNGRMLQYMQLNRSWSDNIYIVKVITDKQVFTARLMILRF